MECNHLCTWGKGCTSYWPVQIYTQETAHSLSFLHHARILECSPSRESPPTFPSHHVSINGTITEFDSFPFTRDLLTWHHQVLQHTSNTSQQCEVQRAIRNMSNQVSTEVDSWIETTKRCQYLPENSLKAREVINRESRLFCFLLMPISSRCPQKLCDYVCDLLLEESNVQPVSSPVTVCGDIHGQVSPQWAS